MQRDVSRFKMRLNWQNDKSFLCSLLKPNSLWCYNWQMCIRCHLFSNLKQHHQQQKAVFFTVMIFDCTILPRKASRCFSGCVATQWFHHKNELGIGEVAGSWARPLTECTLKSSPIKSLISELHLPISFQNPTLDSRCRGISEGLLLLKWCSFIY